MSYPTNYFIMFSKLMSSALVNDALEASKQMDGKELNGRKIKVEISRRSQRSGEENIPEALPTSDIPPIEQVVNTKRVPVTKASEKEMDMKAISTKPSHQIFVLGVPSYIDKKRFKKIISKISRKAFADLIKDDHPLSSTLSTVLSPRGKVFIISCIFKKDMTKSLKS